MQVRVFILLFKVVDTGNKDFLIFIAGNIAIQTIYKAFTVAHFTENASVGTGNAFDCIQRTIGVIGHFHSRNSLWVYILRCDLSVFEQLFDNRFRRIETAFTMRYCYRMDITGFYFAQPWRFIGNDTGVDDLRYMTANIIKGQ